jgi:hypothetical protein
VGGEQELQAGDVPPARVERERAAAEPGAAAAAERAPRLRAGDAVGGQAAAALEALDGRRRGGPGDAVDGARVEPAGAQRDLQGGDVRGGG